MKRIKTLRDKKAALIKEAEVLVAKVDAGTASAEEIARLNAITVGTEKSESAEAVPSELATVNAAIKQEEVLMDERRSMDASHNVNADTEQEAADRLPAEPRREVAKFKSFGEQLKAVAQAGTPGGLVDNRLISGPTGVNESVGSEGGFLVGTDFQSGLLEGLYANGDILRLVPPMTISASSNGVKVHGIDESSRADGARAGGIQAYWTAEAGQIRDTRPKFKEIKLDLEKLTGMCYLTGESLNDVGFLDSWIQKAFNAEFTFKLEDAIINGTGSGMPLGILNSGAVVTVPKETSQANGSILQMNILKMWSRLPARSRANAVWLMNADVEPALGSLFLPATKADGTENVGGLPSYAVRYTPPGANGQGSLQGRPLIVTEYNASLGSVGDIVLFDPTQYLAIDKGQTEAATSIHVRFAYDEQAFRFIYRFNGTPLWHKPLTPYKGANTQSPYVVLAAR